ncbi:MAG: flagellar type III secretion system pore protein FliP [Planctomycetota bacterium]
MCTSSGVRELQAQTTDTIRRVPSTPSAVQQTSFPAPFRHSKTAAAPLPLAAPKQSIANAAQRPATTSNSLTKTVSSWSVIAGVFLVLVWLLRSKLPAATRRLPTTAVALLGRTSIGHRQELQLVRVGNKLLLLGSTANGLSTLTEISDPVEVEQLEQACRDGGTERSSAVSHSVRRVISKFDETARRVGPACLALCLVFSTATGWCREDAARDRETSVSAEVAQPTTETSAPQLLEVSQRWSESLPSGWPTWLLLSALSIAPAILLMTTCFVRMTIVLSMLRQAIGLPQLPPTQVLTALSVFLTILVMTPVWTEVYEQAIVPYQSKQDPISLEESWARGVVPLRRFMSRQIDAAGNSDDIWLFYQYASQSSAAAPATYEEVPLQVLLPAFLLSELKVAFVIGFQIYLPFLVVDLVVAAVTTALGMVMLPPAMISLPLKLLLFVLLNGWHLVVGMLLQSNAPYG